MTVPFRQIRADYDEESIVVYQAYDRYIAEPAVRAGRFLAPFKRERMTWIKPSFRWMMYRCGWATKPGQERVLAIRITRAGFAEALRSSCLSHYDATIHESESHWREQLRTCPVRIQWDPERTTRLEPLPYRSIQIGLSGQAVHDYVDTWIVGISDITEQVLAISGLLRSGEDINAESLIPDERPYPIDEALRATISATPSV